MQPKYWIPAQHDRAETHHETLAEAIRAAEALTSEGYANVSVYRWGTTEAVFGRIDYA